MWTCVKMTIIKYFPLCLHFKRFAWSLFASLYTASCTLRFTFVLPFVDSSSLQLSFCFHFASIVCTTLFTIINKQISKQAIERQRGRKKGVWKILWLVVVTFSVSFTIFLFNGGLFDMNGRNTFTGSRALFTTLGFFFRFRLRYSKLILPK